MSNEVKLTELDSNSIPRYTYEEDLRANRVKIVGSDSIQVNIDTKPLEDAITRSLGLSQKVDYNTSYRHEIKDPPELQKIEVPIIIKEYEIKTIEIEKPVYITKTEYVEVPVIVKQTDIIEIEKPIIIVQKEIKNINLLLILNLLAIISIIAKIFIKG